MENEEEESLNVNKPSLILEDNDKSTMPHPQEEVFHNELQCEPFTAPESLEPRLVGGGESASPRPPTGEVDGDVIEAEESKVEEVKDNQAEENKEVNDGQAEENYEVNEDQAEENKEVSDGQAKELSGVQTKETKDVIDVSEEFAPGVSGGLELAEEATAAEAEEGTVVADVAGNLAATDMVEDTVAAEGEEKGSEVADLADKAVEIEVAVEREVGQSGEEERDAVHSAEEKTEVVEEKGDVTGIVEEKDMIHDREVVDEAVADLGKEPDVPEMAEKLEVEEEADVVGPVEEMEVADKTSEGEGEGEDEDDGDMETETAEEADVADVMEETTEAEETEAVDEAEGMEVVEEVSRVGSGGKRKRGRNLKAPVKAPSRKKGEEDVCFICFDGGELVLCDRRSGFHGHFLGIYVMFSVEYLLLSS